MLYLLSILIYAQNKTKLREEIRIATDSKKIADLESQVRKLNRECNAVLNQVKIKLFVLNVPKF